MQGNLAQKTLVNETLNSISGDKFKEVNTQNLKYQCITHFCVCHQSGVYCSPRKSGCRLLKLCKLILPSVHFTGLHVGLILRTSSQRKNIHSNMLCCTRKLVIHWYFKFCVFAFWFFCISISLFLHQTTLQQTVRELDSHNRYTNIVWIYKECKAWFNSWKWSNLEFLQ